MKRNLNDWAGFVAVLGVGLIGGSIGLAARQRLGAEVVGHGRNPATLERATELGVLDRAAASVAEACEGAEIVFCAGPVAALPGQAREALAACGPETVVTDVGSTKGELVGALGGDERFIGGHPALRMAPSAEADQDGDNDQGTEADETDVAPEPIVNDGFADFFLVRTPGLISHGTNSLLPEQKIYWRLT